MIEVSEDQALYFRAVRSHLAGPGASTPEKAARALVGAQAQQPYPGMLAIGQRTKGRPSAEALKAKLLGSGGRKRTLVRTWGQRETLHIYDPSDWVWIAAAREHWAPAGRRGPMPNARTLDKALTVIEGSGGTATRSDLLGVAPRSYEKKLLDEHGKYIKKGEEQRFAAGRLLWCLSMRGDVCVADKDGREQAYAARSAWFPRLDWPDLDALEACVELTRRYLSVNAPATVKDVAHHFGARQREAKAWVEVLREADELVDVACGDRKGLFALAADAKVLVRKVPAASQWPLRLLPQWDTLLMGHADKSWTVPEAKDQKKVWRSQAVVAAAVLERGRVVAEWKQDTRKDRLVVTVLPLSSWSKKLLAAVKKEAGVVAKHQGLKGADVSVG